MNSVLVIDDAADLRNLVLHMLRAADLQVFEAADGVAGLSIFRCSKPSLVITDIAMPRKDGIETIREIRAIDPRMPIIAMSGGGVAKYPDPLGLAQELGAVGTLQKPFRVEQLLAAVSRALASPGLQPVLRVLA